MNKIIFLDIDGVLNSDIYFNSPAFKEESKGMSWEEIMLIAHHTHLDPVAIHIFNQLVNRSKAEVVLSSTWRLKYSIEALNNMLKDRGATFQINAVTPKHPEYIGWSSFPIPRGIEIQAYLNSLDQKPESFVILDDVDNMVHLINYLILVDDYYGLTTENVEMALNILG